MLACFSWTNHIIGNPTKCDETLIATWYNKLVVIIVLKNYFSVLTRTTDNLKTGGNLPVYVSASTCRRYMSCSFSKNNNTCIDIYSQKHLQFPTCQNKLYKLPGFTTIAFHLILSRVGLNRIIPFQKAAFDS